MAARPATLSSAVVPVAVGTGCAHHVDSFALGPALGALVGAILLQIGANLANDVFDFEKGADTEERLGPTRVVQSGLLRPQQVKLAMALVFAAAAAVGLYLTVVAGWVVVAIGVASILAAIAYTGGPYPLGYHGLGDVFVMAFFGFVAVCGTVLVQVGHVPSIAWWGALSVGSTITCLLVVNNVRDFETDVKAGKRTLIVRWGRRAGVLEYVLLLALAYFVPLVLVAWFDVALFGLMPLLTMPWAIVLARRLSAQRGRSLNKVLVDTAKLALAHGLLLAVGIAWTS